LIVSPVSPIKFRFFPEVFLFLCVSVASGAQETADSIDVGKLLREALYLLIDVEASIPDNPAGTWEAKVKKITVPGRPVELRLHGEDSHLKVEFTLYPAEENKLLLVARSETWVGSEYSSSLTSLTVEYRDALYYYPLGRSSELVEDVEIRMAVEVTPYLDTLSKEDRDAIESALDSAVQFDLSKESSAIK